MLYRQNIYQTKTYVDINGPNNKPIYLVYALLHNFFYFLKNYYKSITELTTQRQSP